MMLGSRLTLSCLARPDEPSDKSDPFMNDGVDDGFESSPCSSHVSELDLCDNISLDFPFTTQVSHAEDHAPFQTSLFKIKTRTQTDSDEYIDVTSECRNIKRECVSGLSDYGSDVSLESDNYQRESSPFTLHSEEEEEEEMLYRDMKPRYHADNRDMTPRYHADNRDMTPRYHADNREMTPRYHADNKKSRKMLHSNTKAFLCSSYTPTSKYSTYSYQMDQGEDVKKRLKEGNLLPREEMNLLRLTCTCNARNTGKGTHLWEFLLEMLADKRMKSIITWTGRAREFKVLNSREVAREWGNRKNKPHMNFDKMSRAMRYYYKKDILTHGNKQRLVYSFGKTSICPHYDKILQVALKTRPNLSESGKDSSFERTASITNKVFHERPVKLYQQALSPSERHHSSHATQTKLLSSATSPPSLCKPVSTIPHPSHNLHSSRPHNVRIFRPSVIDTPVKRLIAKPKIPLRNLTVSGQKSGCFEFNGV